MSEAKPPKPSAWSFVGISAEARRAAEEAAEAAGMELDVWLIQLIKYQSAIELDGVDFQAIQSTAARKVSGPVDALDLVGQGGGGTSDPAGAHLVPIEGLQPSRLPGIESVGEVDVAKALDEWRKTGALEPVTVRPSTKWPGLYEIIAGEDRWQAARRAALSEVSVLVRRVDDRAALVLFLLDRLANLDESPLQEADIYRRFLDDCDLAMPEVAAVTGKPAEHIETMVRLASLPEPVQDMLERGDLTLMHARALFKATDPEAIAREIVRQKLDIFRTEQMIRSSTAQAAAKPQGRSGDGAPGVAPDAGGLKTVAQKLATHLMSRYGLEVTVSESGAGGSVSISFDRPGQLEELSDALRTRTQDQP